MAHETIILINDDDRKDGYFRFHTSKGNDFTKLCKRIGGQENILDIRVTNQGSVVTSWDCKVPIEYLSTKNFSIRQKREVSDEQRQRAKENLQKRIEKKQIASK
jgi:hypothetical protein